MIPDCEATKPVLSHKPWNAEEASACMRPRVVLHIGIIIEIFSEKFLLKRYITYLVITLHMY